MESNKADLLRTVLMWSLLFAILLSDGAFAQPSKSSEQSSDVSIVIDASKSMCAYYGSDEKSELDKVIRYFEGLGKRFPKERVKLYELSSVFPTFTTFQNSKNTDKRQQLRLVDHSITHYTKGRCPEGANAFPHAVVEELLEAKPVDGNNHVLYISDSIMPPRASTSFTDAVSKWLNAAPENNRLEVIAIRARFDGKYFREEPDNSDKDVYKLVGGTRPLYVYWFHKRARDSQSTDIATELIETVAEAPTGHFRFGPWAELLSKVPAKISAPTLKPAIAQWDAISPDGKVLVGKDDCIFIKSDDANRSPRQVNWQVTVQSTQGVCKKALSKPSSISIPIDALLPQQDDNKRFRAQSIRLCKEDKKLPRNCQTKGLASALQLPLPSVGETNAYTIEVVFTPGESIDWRLVRSEWSADQDKCEDQGKVVSTCNIRKSKPGENASPSSSTNLDIPLSKTLRIDQILKGISAQTQLGMQANWTYIHRFAISVK